MRDASHMTLSVEGDNAARETGLVPSRPPMLLRRVEGDLARAALELLEDARAGAEGEGERAPARPGTSPYVLLDEVHAAARGGRGRADANWRFRHGEKLLLRRL